MPLPSLKLGITAPQAETSTSTGTSLLSALARSSTEARFSNLGGFTSFSCSALLWCTAWATRSLHCCSVCRLDAAAKPTKCRRTRSQWLYAFAAGGMLTGSASRICWLASFETLCLPAYAVHNHLTAALLLGTLQCQPSTLEHSSALRNLHQLCTTFSHNLRGWRTAMRPLLHSNMQQPYHDHSFPAGTQPKTQNPEYGEVRAPPSQSRRRTMAVRSPWTSPRRRRTGCRSPHLYWLLSPSCRLCRLPTLRRLRLRRSVDARTRCVMQCSA